MSKQTKQKPDIVHAFVALFVVLIITAIAVLGTTRVILLIEGGS